MIDKSLADAYVYTDSIFRLAISDGTPVGYVLIYPFDRDGKRIVNIVRLMIDARFQGKGLGRSLLTKTLAFVGLLSPDVETVRISTLPENENALNLYRSEGFVDRGIEDGEIALYREVSCTQ
jgi:diamine N-acetyltransferase